jgi:hypothetical protein
MLLGAPQCTNDLIVLQVESRGYSLRRIHQPRHVPTITLEMVRMND